MTAPQTSSAEPSAWRVAVYGTIIFPLNLGQQALLFLAPYYAATFGLSLPVLGGWLTAGRMFDIGADMGVAYLSDRYRSRLGRKPWVIIGLLLFLPSLWFLFVPGNGMNVARYAIALFCFFLTWTMAFIPYLVHGTELASGHARKAAINVVQGVGISAALLISFAGPLLFNSDGFTPWRLALARFLGGFGWPWLDGVAAMVGQKPATGVEGYGLIMLVIVAITSVITPLLLIGYGLFVPDRSVGGAEQKPSPLAAFKNLVFLRFASGYLLVVSGYFITLFLLPFMLAYLYFEADKVLQLSLLMTGTQIVAAPIWYFVLARWERRTCLCAGTVVQAASLVLFMLTPAHSPGMLFVDYCAFGLTGQSLMMVPFLVASDSADYSRWKTGQDSRALHISLISLLIKVGSVAGALFVALLGLAGLQPSAAIQPQSALVAMQGLGLWLPCALLLAGGAIISTHPITRKRQRALQSRIDLRSAA